MSEVKTDKLSPRTGSGTVTLGTSGDTFSIPSGVTLSNSGTASGFGGGKVLQIVQAEKNDTFTHTGTTFTDVTGLSASITPSATSSKILIFSTLNGAANNRYASFRLVRDSTDIFVGDAAGSRTQVTLPIDANSSETDNSYVARNMGLNYLDSPSTTSSITYKIQVANASSGSAITYINRNPDDSDANFSTRAASNIILMEIGA